MKVISFSLWGEDRKYHQGVEANMALAQKHYPGWTLRAYCEPSHCADLIRLGYQVYPRTISRGAWHGLFWRFEPAFDPSVEVFISRDLDSRLNPRDAAALQEWEQSGLFAHVMRDHPEHNVAMLGGMWGCRYDPEFAYWFAEALWRWPYYNAKGNDTAFLCEWVWPKIENRALIHDSVHSHPKIRPFPEHEPLDPTIHGAFVGAIIP